MKYYTILILISSLLLLSLTFSCTPSHSRRTHRNSYIAGVSIDNRNISVEIREKLDKKGVVIERGFNHPYHFTEAGLADILSSVYYRKGGDISDKEEDDEEEKVLREDEVQNIIAPIISAFSMANSTQDILTFTCPHNGVFANSRSYFSMFMTGNELNIVFSKIKCKRSWRTDGRAIQMNTYYRDSNKNIFKDPLEVKRGFRWRLVPMEGQRLAEGRSNWLIIDFAFYGDSNLFGRADSGGDSNNVSGNSIEEGSAEGVVGREAIAE